MKEPVPLAENTARMESALGALMNYSPVPITEGQELGTPALYDERNLCITIDPSYGEAEVFSAPGYRDRLRQGPRQGTEHGL